jgi:uracil-DNA glycosylase
MGWVPDELVEGARVLILAQNPGADEVKGQRVTGYQGPHPVYEPCAPAPLIGKTGYMMEREFFPLAQLERGVNVSLANILKCRLAGSNDMPTGRVLEQAVKHCTDAYLRIPESVELVVAMGHYAAQFRGCVGSVTKWRGYLVP